MASYKKRYYIQHPMRKTVLKNGKREEILISILEIEGDGYFNSKEREPDLRYPFTIDVVLKDGVDFKEELEILGGFEKIEEAVLQHVVKLFNADNLANPLPPDEDDRQTVIGKIPVLKIYEPLNNILNSYNQR